jgi:hypothetical protein
MSRLKYSRRYFSRMLAAVSLVAFFLVALTNNLSAQVVDFETLVATQAVFGFDINNDGIDDVRFSTTNPGGFNTGGPDPSTQVHATGQVLETSSLSAPDIRVDFLGGATGPLQVGFALLTDVGELDQGLLIEVFDQANNQLGSTFQRGELLPITTGLGSGVSGFPEGLISVSFPGVASYALLDATTTGTRFVIDDFTGTFSPETIPEPGSLPVLGFSGLVLLGRRRKKAFK